MSFHVQIEAIAVSLDHRIPSFKTIDSLISVIRDFNLKTDELTPSQLIKLQ